MCSAVRDGNHVLIVWGAATEADKLKGYVAELKSKVGSSGKVVLENVERLSMAAYASSTFDIVLSGVIFPQSIIHSLDLLGEIVKLVKPGGTVVLQEAILSEANGSLLKTKEKLVSTLKLSGLTNISEMKPIFNSSSEINTLRELLKINHNICVVEIQCRKPNFEVGSSSKLSFAKQATSVKPSAQVAAIWTLDSTIDGDIETIDSNILLDEDDLKKPDPSSLRVCGTTGKRKACKNCSCGLAEELSLEVKIAPKDGQNKTSACGSCYLGDAFRCASCPYLGMPAFKPGEKIQLSERQLKADV